MNGVGAPELMIVLLIFAMLLVPVVAVVLLVRSVVGRSSELNPDPRDVLADRLARGQITPSEFDTSMRALGWVD